ncbi:MAG: DUF7344 domain-containing protein [Halodesulfurarchaeum sp.]
MNVRLPHAGTRSTEKPQSEPNNHEPLSTEDMFFLLSNRRRRYAIHHLNQVEGKMSVRDLSEQIAAWENGVDRSAVTPKHRKRVYTSLHQVHLPKMDRLGVVEYDSDRGTVCPADSARDFDIYLDVVSAGDIPWNQFMLGLGATLTALVTAAWVGIPPFSYLGGFPYAIAACLIITVVSGLNVFTDTRRKIGHTSDLDIVPPDEVES